MILTFLLFLDEQQSPTTTSVKDEPMISSFKDTAVTDSPKDAAVKASLQIQPTQCQRGKSHN